MTTSHIEIAFQGPFSLEPQPGLPSVIGGSIGHDESGVYLWTVEHADGYLINYVGKTTAGFASRTKQQVKYMRDNKDDIWDVDRLLKGEKVFLHSRRNPVPNDVFRREYFAQIEKLLRAYRAFWASVESRLAEDVEKSIIDELSRGPYGYFLANVAPGKAYGLSISVSAPATLLGIPSFLSS